MSVLAVTLAVGVPWAILTLPLGYYSGFILPHRFGLSTQTRRGWAIDQAKSSVIAVLIGVPVVLGLYFLLRAAPTTWWLWASAGMAALDIALTALAPVMLIPIFNRSIPLGEDRTELRRRLIALADRAGIRAAEVYQFDMSRRTRAANALLVGLSRTRRILLGDTLVASFSDDEIETVLAHELAHHVHRDIPLGLVAQCLAMLGSLFLLDRGLVQWFGFGRPVALADPASLPALALAVSLIGLVGLPITNGFFRWRESLADSFALRLSRLPMAFASALTRLANQNLAEVDPERWVVVLFYTHPPLRDRISRALRFDAQAKGAG